MAQLGKLRTLVLDGNELTRLPEAVGSLAALEVLKKDGRLLHDIWSPIDEYED